MDESTPEALARDKKLKEATWEYKKAEKKAKKAHLEKGYPEFPIELEEAMMRLEEAIKEAFPEYTDREVQLELLILL